MYVWDVRTLPATSPADLKVGSSRGRGTLATTILGSGMVFLDGSIANIATRQIGRQFTAGFASLQWIIVGYTLALASLILLGGSLGDRYGRRRVYLFGMAWFSLASLACAVAPNVELLIAARVIQGVGGALLAPGSLAIIQASFTPDDALKAVGLWSGMSGVATAAGPLLGGYLVQHVSWRWAFAINVPIGLLAYVLGVRFVPESRQPRESCAPMDLTGTAIVAAALGLLTLGPTRAGTSGWNASSLALTFAGLVGLVFFVVHERAQRSPLVPPSLFASRTFAGANLMTLTTYAALAVVSFLLTLHLR